MSEGHPPLEGRELVVQCERSAKLNHAERTSSEVDYPIAQVRFSCVVQVKVVLGWEIERGWRSRVSGLQS